MSPALPKVLRVTSPCACGVCAHARARAPCPLQLHRDAARGRAGVARVLGDAARGEAAAGGGAAAYGAGARRLRSPRARARACARACVVCACECCARVRRAVGGSARASAFCVRVRAGLRAYACAREFVRACFVCARGGDLEALRIRAKWTLAWKVLQSLAGSARAVGLFGR
eukprot:653838-Pleurochrysis_carterae.AAC.3